MKNTAIGRPLTPRTLTSWSSPPRTSPKAPRKRSSVWRTVVSTIPVKSFLGIIRLPLIRHHIISILVICKHFLAEPPVHEKTRFIILKEHLYAKSGKLLKTVEINDVENIEGRWIPMTALFKDVLKEGGGTKMIIETIEFNKNIPDYIFSKASLRR